MSLQSLKKFWMLPHEQKYLLCSAQFWLPLIRLSLSILGLKKTQALLTIGVSHNKAAGFDVPSRLWLAKTFSRTIDISATHGFYHSDCLCRSLLLLRILKKHRIPCQLMIGARKGGQPPALGAHAWVQCHDEVLNDSAEIALQFAPFPSKGRLPG